MKTETFLRYVSLLTGTEVKGESEIDLDGLDTILTDEGSDSVTDFLRHPKNRISLLF